MNTRIIRIALIVIAASQLGISCQKSARDTRSTGAKGLEQADATTIRQVRASVQQTLSSSDLEDLDWDHSTIERSGNATGGLVIVVSKADPARKLLYLNGTLKMYTWQSQVHYIPVTAGRQ